MKRIVPLLLSLLLIAALAGCGQRASAPELNESYYGSYKGEAVADYDAAQTGESPDGQPTDRSKMIYRADIELETTEFDAAMEALTDLVSKSSGYYEAQDVSGYDSGYRYARLVVRVPSDRFSDFCHQVGNVCHTLRLSTTQENVSESYYDTESRLNTAKTKLARLQELLSQAENMEDIITIEGAISDTEQTIDYLSGTLRGYDSLVDYATVSIELEEVYRLSGTAEAPLTLGRKLGNAFTAGLSSVGEFFEGVLVALVYAWFWLLLLAVVIFVIIRLFRGKKRQKNAADQKTDPAAQ